MFARTIYGGAKGGPGHFEAYVCAHGAVRGTSHHPHPILTQARLRTVVEVRETGDARSPERNLQQVGQFTRFPTACQLCYELVNSYRQQIQKRHKRDKRNSGRNKENP